MAIPSLLALAPSVESVLLITPPCRCGDCPLCDDRDAAERWAELDGPHDFTADLATVNEWNALAADEDRAATDAPPIDLEFILDEAEKAGWYGRRLAIPPGLTDFEAERYADTWRSGRMQRDRDEEEMAREARFRYYDELWEAEERGRMDAERRYA